jgi:hypothetical protein
MSVKMMKQVLRMTVLTSCVLVSSLAHAQPGYETILNAALGNGASVYCGACHLGGVTNARAATAILPMANTWRTGANLALSDSDGDGFTNAQEVSGGATDFNVASITPFTKATGGKALANVYVVGDMQAVEVAAPTSLTIPAGSQLLGNIAVDIYADPTLTAPITLTYKAGGAASTSTVYAIDTYSNVATALAAADWTLKRDGSIQINQLPAGAAASTHDIAVVRVIPTAPPAGRPRGGGEGAEGPEGCVAGQLSMPLMMFLSLFALGFLVRRKKA